jgi:hypothetical protein
MSLHGVRHGPVALNEREGSQDDQRNDHGTCDTN